MPFDSRCMLDLRENNRHTPHAGLVLGVRVPNIGSRVELSSKFDCDTGEAVDLILEAFRIGLAVEGVSFYVGSRCTSLDNFVQSLNSAAAVMREDRSNGTTGAPVVTRGAAAHWGDSGGTPPSTVG